MSKQKSDVEFPEGLRAFSPRDNAPEKLVSNLVFDQEFVDWLQDRLEDDDEVRIGVWWSNDETRHYTQVDNWKPDPNRAKKKASSKAEERRRKASGRVKATEPEEDGSEDDLPF